MITTWARPSNRATTTRAPRFAPPVVTPRRSSLGESLPAGRPKAFPLSLNSPGDRMKSPRSIVPLVYLTTAIPDVGVEGDVISTTDFPVETIRTWFARGLAEPLVALTRPA